MNVISPDSFILRLCDEKHRNIDKKFDDVDKRMNGQDKKLWAIIMMLIANLAGLVVALALVWGKSMMVY